MRFVGNVVRRMGRQQQQVISNGRTHDARYRGHGYVLLRWGGGRGVDVVITMGTQQQQVISTFRWRTGEHRH